MKKPNTIIFTKVTYFFKKKKKIHGQMDTYSGIYFFVWCLVFELKFN